MSRHMPITPFDPGTRMTDIILTPFRCRDFVRLSHKSQYRQEISTQLARAWHT